MRVRLRSWFAPLASDLSFALGVEVLVAGRRDVAFVAASIARIIAIRTSFQA